MKWNLLLIAMIVSACTINHRSGDDGTSGDDEPLGAHQAPPFTGTDPTDADGDGITDELEDYLLAQFGPELRLAPDAIDWTRPANVEWYLPRVRMRFDHPSCLDHEVLATGKVTADSSWQQTHAISSGVEPFCSHTGTKLASGTSTTAFTKQEDFFLQPEDDDLVHPGIPPSRRSEWRVYGHVGQSSYVRASDRTAAAYDIQIWLFYAYNDSVGGVNHEADWEHVTISVTSDLDVVSVYFSAHHEGGRFDDPAKLAWRDRTHPVGYSADGSHAVYETAGEHPSAVPGFPDHTYGGGPIWETWKNVVNLGERGKILNDQGWARYDGRWGEVGDVEDTSGPVGPMYSGRWLAQGSEY